MIKHLLNSSYLTREELMKVGFKTIGKNVFIDRSVIIPNPENISIGNNVRIDAFTLITSGNGNIIVDDNVHIAPYNLIHSGYNKLIHFKKHSFSAAGTKIYGKTDEYLGFNIINPMHKKEHIKQISGDIIIGKLAGFGANCTIFPNSYIPDGTVFGSNTLFNGNKQLKSWSIYIGNPIKFYRERSRECEKMSEEYL